MDMEHLVSALPSVQSSNQQMVFIPSIPSQEVLEVMGRAVFLFAQLEYYLAVMYKRAVPGASLPEIIEQRQEDSLGSLLNGVTERGGKKNFQGLLKISGNAMLDSVMPQLKKTNELLQIRKRYVHWSCARRTSDHKWAFLKSGNETSEAEIIQQLKQAADDIEKVIAEIQNKIPTPKPIHNNVIGQNPSV